MDNSSSAADQEISLTSAGLTDAPTSTSASTPDASDADSAAPGRPATPGKKKSSPSAPSPTERVGQPYRLPQNLDWGIRYAALMLEQQDGTRRNQQDIVDQAVLELLQRLKKKGIDFPASILP